MKFWYGQAHVKWNGRWYRHYRVTVAETAREAEENIRAAFDPQAEVHSVQLTQEYFGKSVELRSSKRVSASAVQRCDWDL